ncbi:MAG: HupE/UreJ family protein [Acidimicrobiales bacterium]|nr:HupE/UreJ family protein [Acidimicrobiales bacterium]
MRTRRGKLTAMGLLTALLSLLWGGVAQAHTGKQSYVYVDLLSDRIEGRVEYLVKDINDELKLAIVDDEATAMSQLEEQRSILEAYTREHFSIEFPTGPAELTFEEFEYLELSQGSYVVHHFSTGTFDGGPPREFVVNYDAFFDGDDERSALLIIGRDWKNGVIANEANHLSVFDENNTSAAVNLDEGSWLQGMRGTISLGIEHIRTGADHVMFILVLLLPSVLLFGSGVWQPAPRFSASLLRVMKVASAFTVAHSITLTLAALGLLNINSKLVESIIAISIVLAALHNLRPVLANREWMLAFGFGLFHGLGFAGLLDELGLARDQRVWTLLGFNLGVELGQTAIILLTFPTLYLLRRTRYYLTIMRVASLLLALAALGWALERVFELRPRVDTLFDPILYYPRVLILLGAAAAVAGIVHYTEKRRSRLVPITGD